VWLLQLVQVIKHWCSQQRFLRHPDVRDWSNIFNAKLFIVIVSKTYCCYYFWLIIFVNREYFTIDRDVAFSSDLNSLHGRTDWVTNWIIWFAPSDSGCITSMHGAVRRKSAQFSHKVRPPCRAISEENSGITFTAIYYSSLNFN